MKIKNTKITRKKIIISLLTAAAVFAVIAAVVALTSRVTNESYENCALGDINGDGYISSEDALLIIDRISNGTELFENQLKNADVNRDDSVDSMDALILLRYSVGAVKNLPYDSASEQDSNGSSAETDEKAITSSAKIINDWDNADGTHSYQISITFKNNGGNYVDGWSADIKLSETAKLSKNWDCRASAAGSTVTIKGGSVPSQSAAVCGVIVIGSDALKIENIETEYEQ